MSEKIFALLLRLYPARFRARYGEESLQLLRDRLRDEPGLTARIRLTFDLLTDTAFALPRAHRIGRPAMQIATTRGPLAGLPSFGILDRPPLRRSTVIGSTENRARTQRRPAAAGKRLTARFWARLKAML